jgi:hypothetical protein
MGIAAGDKFRILNDDGEFEGITDNRLEFSISDTNKHSTCYFIPQRHSSEGANHFREIIGSLDWDKPVQEKKGFFGKLFG